MDAAEREQVVIVPGIARSKYARSAQRYQETVNTAARRQIDRVLRSRNLTVASGHRVDLDNLLKSVLDGLKGAAYEDDSQIVKVSAERYNISESFVVEGLIRPDELEFLAEGQDFIVVTISHR